MLELLSLRKGDALTKEMFLNHLYGGMDEPELKIIDVFICKLRKKLSLACGGDNYIETVWGRGYVLRDAEGDTAATEVAPNYELLGEWARQGETLRRAGLSPPMSPGIGARSGSTNTLQFQPVADPPGRGRVALNDKVARLNCLAIGSVAHPHVDASSVRWW